MAAPLGSCFPLQPSAEASPPAGTDKAAAAKIWCVNNAAATFMVADAGDDKPTGALELAEVSTVDCREEYRCDCMYQFSQAATCGDCFCADVTLDLRSPLGVVPAALQGAATPAVRATRIAANPAMPPEPLRPGDRRLSMDSVDSPSKHAISRPSPQFLSYRRYCRERNLGQRSDSSARLKVRTLVRVDTHYMAVYARHLVDRRTLALIPLLLQVSSVDFRRIWLDKDSKDPSREGIGIWRPVPPPGYYSLGRLFCMLQCMGISAEVSSHTSSASLPAAQVTASPKGLTRLTRPPSFRCLL